MWKSLADLLRMVLAHENIRNMSQWLSDENFSEQFVADYLKEYPEFKTQSAGGVSGQASGTG